MTIKVNEIVVDALEYLITQAEEAPIEATEARAVMRTLNDMMSAWDALGISLGYTEVSDLGDTVTVPLGAKLGIKANLAVFIADKYDIPISPNLARIAKIGYEAILNLATDTAEMAYPDTLPQGSGNTYPSYADDTFYPDQQGTILTETGGAVALEEDTET